MQHDVQELCRVVSSPTPAVKDVGVSKRLRAGFLSDDACLCATASGQCREQNERHLRRRNHPQALQREDGGTLPLSS